jgi:hypothetical protein
MIYRLKFFCKFQSVGFYCLPHSLINVPFQRAGHPQFGPGGRGRGSGSGRRRRRKKGGKGKGKGKVEESLKEEGKGGREKNWEFD